ncbi:hypothetical protein K438DRAFT_1768641 [Mycena galopus ATCC 62051]|nr:hypothetical protein K438DRAFT_1768641 [Mycena galopus ATCC 62051]
MRISPNPCPTAFLLLSPIAVFVVAFGRWLCAVVVVVKRASLPLLGQPAINQSRTTPPTFIWALSVLVEDIRLQATPMEAYGNGVGISESALLRNTEFVRHLALDLFWVNNDEDFEAPLATGLAHTQKHPQVHTPLLSTWSFVYFVDRSRGDQGSSLRIRNADIGPSRWASESRAKMRRMRISRMRLLALAQRRMGF